jgi:hypothetical protein
MMGCFVRVAKSWMPATKGNLQGRNPGRKSRPSRDVHGFYTEALAPFSEGEILVQATERGLRSAPIVAAQNPLRRLRKGIPTIKMLIMSERSQDVYENKGK